MTTLFKSHIGTVLRVQIIDLLHLNELFARNKKPKAITVAVSAGIAMLIVFVCAYNVLTAKTLADTGSRYLIPAYTVAVAGFSVLFLTLFYSNGILFAGKDTELLASLPIKTGDIIASKLLCMYIFNILICAAFIIPGGIVWLIYAKTDILNCIFFMLSAFFVPLIPMCLASILGIAIIFVSSHFKSRSIGAALLSFIAAGIIIWAALGGAERGEQSAERLVALPAKQITVLYPLAKFFLSGTKPPENASMLLFYAASIAVFSVFIKLTAVKYARLNVLANKTSKYKKKTVYFKERSPFVALYKKELGRFFSSYVAMANMGFGIVLLGLFGIFLLIMPVQKLGASIGIPNAENMLKDYAPLIAAVLFALSCPAAASVSLEGKNIWILQSAPLPVKTVLAGKIAATLTLHFFGYLLPFIAMVLRMPMNAGHIINLAFIPACYSLFSAVLGISLNKKLPNYDWTSEVVVVKQSLPVMASGIIGMFFAALPVFITYFFGLPSLPTIRVIACMLAAAALIMYRISCASKL